MFKRMTNAKRDEFISMGIAVCGNTGGSLATGPQRQHRIYWHSSARLSNHAENSENVCNRAAPFQAQWRSNCNRTELLLEERLLTLMTYMTLIKNYGQTS